MTLVVVPPLTDPTVTVAVRPGEHLLDLNQRFARRAADPVGLRGLAAALDVLPAPNARGAERCLLARAAADALCEPAGPITRLRALGAAVRVLSADDAGLTASIDDIRLRIGTTQRSADAVLAAARCTLFDRELSAVPPAGELHVIVDADQQLPATLRLLGWAGPGRSVTLSGRFVAEHRDALAALPALAGVRLDPAVRPRTVDASWSPVPGRETRWCTHRDEIPADGSWAGWLDAAAADLPGSAAARCTGLVVGVGGPEDPEDLAGTLTALAERVPVAVEVLVGASGGTRRSEAWWSRAGARVRVAGFRPYRPPLPPDHGASGDQDLARWAAENEAATVAVRELLADAAARRELFPGRVAGALFAVDDAVPFDDDWCWDPAVRLVHSTHAAPAGSMPGDFLVNLRSGRLTRVQPAMARLLGRIRRGGQAARQAAVALPDERWTRLLNGLHAAGVLRKAAVTA